MAYAHKWGDGTLWGAGHLWGELAGSEAATVEEDSIALRTKEFLTPLSVPNVSSGEDVAEWCRQVMDIIVQISKDARLDLEDLRTAIGPASVPLKVTGVAVIDNDHFADPVTAVKCPSVTISWVAATPEEEVDLYEVVYIEVGGTNTSYTGFTCYNNPS